MDRHLRRIRRPTESHSGTAPLMLTHAAPLVAKTNFSPRASGTGMGAVFRILGSSLPGREMTRISASARERGPAVLHHALDHDLAKHRGRPGLSHVDLLHREIEPLSRPPGWGMRQQSHLECLALAAAQAAMVRALLFPGRHRARDLRGANIHAIDRLKARWTPRDARPTVASLRSAPVGPAHEDCFC